jgi:hypothetical protein
MRENFGQIKNMNFNAKSMGERSFESILDSKSFEPTMLLRI